MKRDPFRDQAEKNRKKIIAEKKEEQVTSSTPLTRVEMHSQKREQKQSKKKPFPLIGVLLGLFVLLPLIAVVGSMVFSGEEDGLTNAVVERPVNEFQKDNGTANSVSATSPEEDEEQEETADENFNQDESSTPPAESEEEPVTEAPADEQPVEEAPEETVEETPAPASETTHTVQPQETLYRIAVNYGLGSDGVDRLRELNGLSGNEIYTGQVLKIPAQ
ncbi:LysM peptidoglycan-binding domain-containing protein [Jeotgalibacillus sp. R-1-5s-1]|uniref:LysM peptidoglycan-binding domain-containing protein n=1 Tax=Jeotgalibacillus sp. R-1-5s-1 TaxID=2555897 RepID=UPI00106CE79F|nr:LysM peptidoglycan-binding domain-containing protein [Jeotgalibacillus sp. R-1-5s-1]TFE00435.1 LysM peptidoglycan-binding domain-containing protein [Jeotgalibacillus sp. R-1-5s-1]